MWPLAWPSLETEGQGRQETTLAADGSYCPHLEIQALAIYIVLSLSANHLVGGVSQKPSFVFPVLSREIFLSW